MDSWYFLCDVSEEIFERNLEDYEREYDYQVAWLTLTDIIKKNEAVQDYEKFYGLYGKLWLFMKLRKWKIQRKGNKCNL